MKLNEVSYGKLIEIFLKMGLGIIFERANFNGIIQESASSSFQLSVRVNRVTHKTYFEVDRFGTRAEATNGKKIENWIP